MLDLRAGDVIVVPRLDRLARGMCDLLDIIRRIRRAGAGLRILAEPWADAMTPAGRMILTVSGDMAKCERSVIVEHEQRPSCSQGTRHEVCAQADAHAGAAQSSISPRG
ncbi:recombinase family protein [Paraburkholderia sp. RL17-373-BIF-A]